MSTRLVSVDRQTPMLLPPDLRDWVPEDDLVHFILEALDGMKLSGLKVNERGTGSEQYPPRMMLGLLIYCYANGIFSSRRIERAEELRLVLEADVQELMEETEKADRSDDTDGQKLPDKLARRQALKAKMEKARHDLEARAQARAAQEQVAYDAKVQEREKRRGNLKGPKPKPPKQHPEGDEQVNLSDPDSRLMRKNKRSGYEQSYNAQAVVDAEGSQLILGARISQCASDRRELQQDMGCLPESIGKPAAVLADSGYACEEEVTSVEESGTKVYVSTGAEAAHQHRKYDLRPSHRRSERPPKAQADWIIDMRKRLNSESGRELYKLRKQTVEPVFGIMKHVLGFRQFHLRGLAKVDGEWELLSLAYNMKRLWSLKCATAG